MKTDIRAEVREIEKHVKSLTPSPAAQLAIVGKVQSMVRDDAHSLAVLIVVKNRIIHETK